MTALAQNCDRKGLIFYSPFLVLVKLQHGHVWSPVIGCKIPLNFLTSIVFKLFGHGRIHNLH